MAEAKLSLQIEHKRDADGALNYGKAKLNGIEIGGKLLEIEVVDGKRVAHIQVDDVDVYDAYRSVPEKAKAAAKS